MEHNRMVVDTSIFIEHLRSKNKRHTKLFEISDNITTLYISTITIFELYSGATNEQKYQDVKLLTEDLNILPLTIDIAKEGSKIFQNLRKRNEIIEFRDILIGATAKINNLPVKTINKKHFQRITGLTIL